MKSQKVLKVSEHDEAVALAQYLDILKTQGKIELFSHIPNETFTRNWGTKMKNKQEGVRPGVPDYIVVTKDKIGFIELKRKGGVVSKDQRQWFDSLGGKSTGACIAYGFEPAKRFVEELLRKNI